MPGMATGSPCGTPKATSSTSTDVAWLGAAVAWAECGEGVGVGGTGVQEVAGPLGHVRVRGALGDLGAGGHGVIGGAAHLDGAVGQDRPVRARPAVGHAD